jgi:hypothetical protein
MNAIIDNQKLNLIIANVCQGAVCGALIGTNIVSTTLAFGIFQNFLEKGSRAIGNEPKLPFFEGDCELEKFYDFSICTNPLSAYSFTSYTICVISTTTVSGMVIGAISGIARSVLTKS